MSKLAFMLEPIEIDSVTFVVLHISKSFNYWNVKLKSELVVA